MVNDRIMIGNMELNGRIIMPPIATYRCDEMGHVTEEVCDYYAARAANPNVSLIITEHNYITWQGKAKKKQMSITDDDCIPGLKKLVDAIHKSGAKAVSQISHAGAAAVSEASGMHAVAPSPVNLPTNPPIGDQVLPEELTKDQIKNVVKDFADAAVRAKEAGYDGVEIHSAHAYLLNQFYSPLTNKRTDEYGGGIENRLRIHREVIRAVRNVVGNGYPVFIRFGACDYMDGGSTAKDAVQAAKVLESEGISLIDVSGGMCRYTREGHDEPGYFCDASKAIKEAVSVPVNLTGGIKSISEAEELLEKRYSDLIGVGRELLKNPNWERNKAL